MYHDDGVDWVEFKFFKAISIDSLLVYDKKYKQLHS